MAREQGPNYIRDAFPHETPAMPRAVKDGLVSVDDIRTSGNHRLTDSYAAQLPEAAVIVGAMNDRVIDPQQAAEIFAAHAATDKTRILEFQLSELTDEKSGLYNAKGFNHRVAQAITNYASYGTPLTIMHLRVSDLATLQGQIDPEMADLLSVQIGEYLRAQVRHGEDFTAKISDDEYMIGFAGNRLRKRKGRRRSIELTSEEHAERIGARGEAIKEGMADNLASFFYMIDEDFELPKDGITLDSSIATLGEAEEGTGLKIASKRRGDREIPKDAIDSENLDDEVINRITNQLVHIAHERLYGKENDEVNTSFA